MMCYPAIDALVKADKYVLMNIPYITIRFLIMKIKNKFTV